MDTMKSFVAGISPKHIAHLGNWLGTLIHALDGPHRRIVRRNLKFTHTNWSEGRVRAHARRIFQNLGVTLLEILQMSCFGREQILRSVRIDGEDHLRRAGRSATGSIFISAHLGNWEMGPQFVACYLNKPMASVARPLHPGMLDRWVLKFRTRFGNTIIQKEGALPEMSRAIRKGVSLGLLIDQGTKRSEGVEVTFFGRKVMATPGAALLAIRTGCPVLPVFCVRNKSGGLTLVVAPPLVLERTKDLRRDLRTHTQIMTHALEKVIREYSDQWFWFHKRWKRFYPELYPEYQARRLRRNKRRQRVAM